MDLFKRFSGKKRTILIIEDDQETATLLTHFIQLRGYQAISAEDGVKGMEIIQKKLPDLVLLDIMLPHMSGFDILLQIKSQPETKEVPVIMCSALNGVKDIERCSQWGANGYITKPFDLERVVKKIRSILGASN